MGYREGAPTRAAGKGRQSAAGTRRDNLHDAREEPKRGGKRNEALVKESECEKQMASAVLCHCTTRRRAGEKWVTGNGTKKNKRRANQGT